jgi:CRISPR-associated Csx2 family protein
MAVVLISFIGKGTDPKQLREEVRARITVSKSGYARAVYKFPAENDFPARESETTIFGSALLKRLQEMGRAVSRWLIMGTQQSVWNDLIEMFPDEQQTNLFDIWNKVDDAINGKANLLTQELLNDWQSALAQEMGGVEVLCRLVGTATKPDSQKKIFESLLETIANGSEVVFDVTHGLRNQPIITSFALMYLRWLRGIRNVEFYYGAFELQGEVVKLDFCQEILEATEAVAIFAQTGNVYRIGEQISLSETFQQNLRTLTFADEMFRLKPGIAQKVKNELRSGEAALKNDPLKRSLADQLKESLQWSGEHRYARRLKEKAIKEFRHQQYFKAVASLWEAVLIAGCQKFSLNPQTQSNRTEAKEKLYGWFQGKPELADLKNLAHLRNAILHGSDSDNRAVQKAVEQVEAFKTLFERGLTLVDTILA